MPPQNRAMSEPSSASHRLFLGLWPPPEVHAQLVLHAQGWHWPAAARRTPPERLHVTLHFIGEVPAARLPELREGLATQWEGCELLLDQAQVWPGGIAVLEATQVPPPLEALHAELAQRLRRLDLPVETRRYRPHATLARHAVGARPPLGFTPLRWPARPGYALVRSLPGGRVYETLQAFG